jgi:hypothetical protein
MPHSPPAGFRDAADSGFHPTATGTANRQALQQALDHGGTVTISRPGTYAIAGTVYIGSHTALLCGAGVVLRKVDEQGPFSHVILNKGALTRTWDQDIVVDGLHIEVNGIDVRQWQVFGLHGQVAFFYARDVAIRRFRCYDLGKAQYGIHVCTFEDLLVDDVIIHGHKDGVHLGRGRRFTIRNGVFGTSDDAVALNAHDYDVGNPELGWIEHGVIENCHDLRVNRDVGFFARILAGGWSDWRPGMEVQKSDTVVSEGRLYRVSAQPDGRVFTSRTRPVHASGAQELDGITWVMVQTDATYTAGVRQVTLRDIFLSKPRIGMSIHFDDGWYSRSYYPGSPRPVQEQLMFDGVHVLHDEPTAFLACNTPVDAVTIAHSTFRDNHIAIHGKGIMPDAGRTGLNLIGNTFRHPGPIDLLRNDVPGKRITLSVDGSQVVHDGFAVRTAMADGTLRVLRSDLPGLAATG